MIRGCKSEDALVRVPHEHQLFFVQLKIGPDTELIHVSRAGKDSTEWSKLGSEYLRADHTALLQAFKSAEKKGPVLTDWAPNRQPILPALEKRIGVERVPMQCGISRKMVVPKEKEAGTMKLITAGASCNIHRPACGCSGAQIEVRGRDLEFLHRFLPKTPSPFHHSRLP